MRLVVELEKDVVVASKGLRYAVPELDRVALAALQRHLLLLRVVVVPLEIEDDDRAHVSELLDELLDQDLVLAAEVRILPEAAVRRLC